MRIEIEAKIDLASLRITRHFNHWDETSAWNAGFANDGMVELYHAKANFHADSDDERSVKALAEADALTVVLYRALDEKSTALALDFYDSGLGSNFVYVALAPQAFDHMMLMLASRLKGFQLSCFISDDDVEEILSNCDAEKKRFVERTRVDIPRFTIQQYFDDIQFSILD